MIATKEHPALAWSLRRVPLLARLSGRTENPSRRSTAQPPKSRLGSEKAVRSILVPTAVRGSPYAVPPVGQRTWLVQDNIIMYGASPINNLVQLQTLESDPGASPTSDPVIGKLRKRIPANILMQYDRFRARGKKGVALVRHSVCGQCHMQVPIGLLAALRRQEDIVCCQHCGSYLSLVEEFSETPLKSVTMGSRILQAQPMALRS
jgi:hypothetical protein